MAPQNFKVLIRFERGMLDYHFPTLADVVEACR